MSEFRFGVIGCGVIANKFADAVASLDGVEIAAVSDAFPTFAGKFAEAHGINKVYTDCQELIQDPDIDAVYIAVTNTAHYELTKAALTAGKPVFCEKPFTMVADQAVELIGLARQKNLFLAENLWTKYLPIYREIRDIIKQKKIGDLRVIHTDYFFCSDFDPNSRLFDPKKGGGALLDIGIYGMGFIGMFLGYRPENVISMAGKGQSNVDERVYVGLQYAGGVLADTTCAISTPAPQRAVIIGTKGRIEIPEFGRAVTATVYTYGDGKIDANSAGAGTRSSVPAGGETWTLSYPFRKNGFEYIVEAAVTAIRNGEKELPLATLEETLAWIDIKERARKCW